MKTVISAEEAARYRIDAAINKTCASSDCIEMAQKRLRNFSDGNAALAFDAIERDPNFLTFLFESRILATLQFLFYLAKDIKRIIGRSTNKAILVVRLRLSNVVPATGRFKPEEIRAARLFIDVSGVRDGKVGGGIKRVCDRIGDALVQSGRAQPCEMQNGKLVEVNNDSQPIVFQAGDTYLIFSSFWDPCSQYIDIAHYCRNNGGRNVLCIYDILPISKPKLVADDYSKLFRDCYNKLLPILDLVVSISHSSAAEVEAVTREMGSQIPVRFFNLGADAFKVTNTWQPDFSPAFLSIGTLEPKKGYDIAIDAFEILWSEGLQATYNIVGKSGWLCDALVRRITNHPDYGRRLFWHPDLPDVELGRFVETSYCLVQASLAEGFGLPVAEAALAGLPVIASDLPVFREICVEGAVFFPVGDAAALAKAIAHAVELRPVPVKLNVPTWQEAAAGLLVTLDQGITDSGRSNETV